MTKQVDGVVTRSKSKKETINNVRFRTEEEAPTETTDQSYIEALEEDKKLDNIGAHYMRLGHDDEMIFEDLNTNYAVDHDSLSMFVVELPVSQHGRTDVIEAKK